jgi:hypothetical protein
LQQSSVDPPINAGGQACRLYRQTRELTVPEQEVRDGFNR